MENKDYFKFPDQLLKELGITAPDEIDIEAIAFHCGATVRYRSLTGCAARIVGNGNNAIITVDSASPRPRQRFSAAHELGHWMYDRGKASLSCQEAQFLKEWSASNPEALANRYASGLLLPVALFVPIAKTLRAVDFTAVRSLAQKFTTSLTATAIRLVEYGPLPAMLVCYGSEGREWFVRAPSIPDQLWPSGKPEKSTLALQLLNSAAEGELNGEVPARAWFDHPTAGRYYIQEHSFRPRTGWVLSLLWWKDERMLIELQEFEEAKASRRSDGRMEE
jgi:hypothetical protein